MFCVRALYLTDEFYMLPQIFFNLKNLNGTRFCLDKLIIKFVEPDLFGYQLNVEHYKWI